MNNRTTLERREPERAALERRWLRLTRETLPGLAAEQPWPVRFDHCFQRILLDHACGTVWYDRIDRRPAYTHAPDDILESAVALGERIAKGESDLDALNRQSLEWRGKAAARTRSQRPLARASRRCDP